MTLTTVRLAAPPHTVVTVPGSKSVANRMLTCASLADGVSVLSGLPDGDDTAVLVNGLPSIGVGIDRVSADTVRVTGRHRPSGGNLWCGLAGTSSRFATALAALGSSDITIDGGEPLRRRPIGPLLDALRVLGAQIVSDDNRLPVTVCGPATGSVVAVRGDISSQFISALMMIGPLLPEGLRIEVTGTLVSRSYVEMTAAVMSIFGHTDIDVSSTVVTIGAGRYLPVETLVEPDASSASYPMAIAALTGGTIEIPGLTDASLQGDASLAEILQSMGCDVERNRHGCTVTGPTSPLEPFDLDMSDISDLVPTMAVLATQASAECRIRGVGFIRAKESDRLNVLATQLSALGADISETDDGLIIRPSALHGGSVAVHDDHRMAMAFGVLGTVIDGITVDEPEVVTKSWPSFWGMIEGLRQ